MPDSYPEGIRAEDEAFDGLPSQVPSLGSVPSSASPNNVVLVGGNARPFVVDQEILVGPTQNHRLQLDGGASSVKPISVDQDVLVGPAQTAGANVAGGAFQPGNANIQDVTQNNVAAQVFGSGLPKSVNV